MSGGTAVADPAQELPTGEPGVTICRVWEAKYYWHIRFRIIAEIGLLKTRRALLHDVEG